MSHSDLNQESLDDTNPTAIRSEADPTGEHSPNEPSPDRAPGEEDVVAIARRAYKAFAQGWETGDFEPYIEMLAEEVTFWFPTGKHRGKFAGIAGRQEMIAECHDHLLHGDRLMLQPPRYVLTDGRSVLFEFEVDGTLAGHPYAGHNAIAFEIRNGKVAGFREYIGDLGK